MTASAQPQDFVTVINIMTVQPGTHDAVAKLQLDLVENVKRDWPGFIAQTTLISTDGTKVATIERWRTQADVYAIANDAGLLEYRRQIQHYAELAPALYEIVGDSQSPLHRSEQ